MIAPFRRSGAVEAVEPIPAPATARESLREAQAAASSARLIANDAAAAVGRAREIMAERQGDVDRLADTDRQVASHMAEAIRAGSTSQPPLPPALAALKRLQTEAREQAAVAQFCGDIIETEHATARHAADTADANVSAAVDELLHEAAGTLVEQMREAEVLAGRMRLALIGALVGGELSLIGMDDGHGPEIRAAERAGFKPDPARWMAFRSALAADPEAIFDLS